MGVGPGIGMNRPELGYETSRLGTKHPGLGTESPGYETAVICAKYNGSNLHIN